MGCLICAEQNKTNDSNKQSDDEQVDYTETYDPANLSVSRDSTMADYQFTGKKPRGSFKLQSNMKRAIRCRLSTIQDDVENDNINAINTNKEAQPPPLPLPHKRVIFISIAQLNACIDDIPDYILSESIFCFRAQRSWFWPRNVIQYREAQHSLRHKMSLNDKFLNVLKRKDKSNLVLWLEEDKTWHNISDELIQIEDVYYAEVAVDHAAGDGDDTVLAAHDANRERRRYDALKLDTSWWLNDFDNADGCDRSMYCDSADRVVEELVTSQLKFNPTMELLYQSNPTLIPMRGFDFEMYLNHHYAEKEVNKEDTTLQRDVNDIVPALTPYSPPFSLHNMAHNVANTMPTIDINRVNITPAPSNRAPLKLNSNESFAMEGSMVCVADMNYQPNPHQIDVLNLDSNEI
eukprot:144932_1